MDNDKITDICLLCGKEPTKECIQNHKEDIEEVKVFDVLPVLKDKNETKNYM